MLLFIEVDYNMLALTHVTYRSPFSKIIGRVGCFFLSSTITADLLLACSGCALGQRIQWPVSHKDVASRRRLTLYYEP